MALVESTRMGKWGMVIVINDVLFHQFPSLSFLYNYFHLCFSWKKKVLRTKPRLCSGTTGICLVDEAHPESEILPSLSPRFAGILLGGFKGMK